MNPKANCPFCGTRGRRTPLSYLNLRCPGCDYRWSSKHPGKWSEQFGRRARARDGQFRSSVQGGLLDSEECIGLGAAIDVGWDP